MCIRDRLSTPGISTAEAKRALDEFEQEKGRSAITEDLFQSLITDLSSEGFFTFNETTNTLHP